MDLGGGDCLFTAIAVFPGNQGGQAIHHTGYFFAPFFRLLQTSVSSKRIDSKVEKKETDERRTSGIEGAPGQRIPCVPNRRCCPLVRGNP